MRKVLILSCLAVSLVASTGCQSCMDRFCRFETAKNEALFGWMRGPQPQSQTVCYDPCAQGGEIYGAPVMAAPSGDCCHDSGVTTIGPTPAPVP